MKLLQYIKHIIAKRSGVRLTCAVTGSTKELGLLQNESIRALDAVTQVIDSLGRVNARIEERQRVNSAAITTLERDQLTLDATRNNNNAIISRFNQLIS